MICKHDHLEFRDQGTRIICNNDKCGRTWFRENAPGSCMPFLGLVPIEEMINSTETRSNPYAVKTFENLLLTQKNDGRLGKNESIPQLPVAALPPPKPRLWVNSKGFRQEGKRTRQPSNNLYRPRDTSSNLPNIQVGPGKRTDINTGNRELRKGRQLPNPRKARDTKDSDDS